MPKNVNSEAGEHKLKQIEFIKQSFEEQGLNEEDALRKASEIINNSRDEQRSDPANET